MQGGGVRYPEQVLECGQVMRISWQGSVTHNLYMDNTGGRARLLGWMQPTSCLEHLDLPQICRISVSEKQKLRQAAAPRASGMHAPHLAVFASRPGCPPAPLSTTQ